MLWDSGVVSSNASSLVSYGADADLAADTVAFWRVGLRFTAVDSNENDISDIKRAKFNGNETVWSSISRFSIGPDGAKLTARAQFIGLPGAARTLLEGASSLAGGQVAAALALLRPVGRRVEPRRPPGARNHARAGRGRRQLWRAEAADTGEAALAGWGGP